VIIANRVDSLLRAPQPKGLTGNLTVLLADDNPLALRGLESLLASQPGVRVTAAYPDGLLALEAIRQKRPDVAVLDASMPGRTGFDVAEAIMREGLGTRTILLMRDVNEGRLDHARRTGVFGIVKNEQAIEQLPACIRTVAEGGKHYPPADRPKAADVVRKKAALAVSLTDREFEIAELVSEGLSNRAIGQRCGVSEGTVKCHLQNVFQKLRIKSRTELTARVFEQRAVAPLR
jgi:two-component system nitrate/nitrite response regulator NarL